MNRLYLNVNEVCSVLSTAVAAMFVSFSALFVDFLQSTDANHDYSPCFSYNYYDPPFFSNLVICPILYLK